MKYAYMRGSTKFGKATISLWDLSDVPGTSSIWSGNGGQAALYLPSGGYKTMTWGEEDLLNKIGYTVVNYREYQEQLVDNMESVKLSGTIRVTFDGVRDINGDLSPLTDEDGLLQAWATPNCDVFIKPEDISGIKAVEL